VSAAGPHKTAVALSAREAEVVQLLVRGLTNRQIAQRLGIGERSVDSHLDHVRDRLGLRTRVEIAAWAIAEGVAPRE
jgi:DNA-binding CsgD family transcriptional regulator